MLRHYYLIAFRCEEHFGDFVHVLERFNIKFKYNKKSRRKSNQNFRQVFNSKVMVKQRNMQYRKPVKGKSYKGK